jgi:hypothetical protein
VQLLSHCDFLDWCSYCYIVMFWTDAVTVTLLCFGLVQLLSHCKDLDWRSYSYIVMVGTGGIYCYILRF